MTYWDKLRNRRTSSRYGARCASITAIIVVVAILWFVIKPWMSSTTGSSSNVLLIMSMVFFSTCVFLCSAAELAIAGTTIKEFDAWERMRTRGYTISPGKMLRTAYRIRGNLIRFVLEESDTQEQRHTAWTNSIIVIVNTFIVVLLSVVTDKYAPADAPETFAVIGVTVITTLVGEVVPKQIAVTRALSTLLWVWWWVWLLFITRLLPMVAFGLVWPVERAVKRLMPAGATAGQ